MAHKRESTMSVRDVQDKEELVKQIEEAGGQARLDGNSLTITANDEESFQRLRSLVVNSRESSSDADFYDEDV